MQCQDKSMERKGFRVNMKKTKFMISGIGLDFLKYSGLYPCQSNAIRCCQYELWVHRSKKCSGIHGRITSVDLDTFECLRCSGDARPIDGRPFTQVDVYYTVLVLMWSLVSAT